LRKLLANAKTTTVSEIPNSDFAAREKIKPI
jgi:hypothetical protein